MTLSLIKLLKSGPPPPRVVLLPDAMFFTRAIEIDSAALPTDVAAQVELALEALSPFPPAQLYHGFYWSPGAGRALIFAAYRRRFTMEQLAEWDAAELVVPAFATLLGGNVDAGTTLVIPSAEGLTAIYWDESPVPARVVFQPIAAEATEPDRARMRDELLRAMPANHPILLAAPPVIETAGSDREFAFHAEAFRSQLPASVAASLDVRDKAELDSLRRARRRDLALWRGFLGLAAALVLLAAGELALIGGGIWLKARRAQADAQRPLVETIMTQQGLTTRINELSTKRLLPFEMISIITAKKPAAVTFLRTTTDGLYGLSVEAYTNSPAAVSTYQAALTSLPELQKVEVRDQRTRDNVMSFTLALVFRPEALKPVVITP